MSTPSQKHLVTRTGIYYYRYTIPKDLQQHYPKKELKVSLKTSHKDAALLLFSSMESKIQMEFAMLRSGVSVSTASASPTERTSERPTESNLSGLIKLFLAEKAKGWTRKTEDEFTATFNLFEKYFRPDKDATQISRQDCIQLREKLLKGWGSKGSKKSRAPKTVNKMLTLLGSVYKYPVILHFNQFHTLQTMREDKRERDTSHKSILKYQDL
jgi:hypothetical protein